MFEGIKDTLHGELRDLENKFANGENLTVTDLDQIDKMAHALKCLATYEAMENAEPRSRARYTRDSRDYRDDPYWNRR